MLEPVADDVWAVARPLRFLGLSTGTRMTVARLRDGGLFVHSPVALDAELRAAVDALGPVRAVIAPCLFHHLQIGAWAQAYPDAVIAGCPGLSWKRKDVPWSAVLGETPEPAWDGALDQVFFGACPMVNEVVFFHRASRTIISSDLIFNLSTHPSAFTRAVGRVIGTKEPGPTLVERWTIRDRKAARGQVDRMLAWGAERVVLAHGDIVTERGSEVLEKGYRWL